MPYTYAGRAYDYAISLSTGRPLSGESYQVVIWNTSTAATLYTDASKTTVRSGPLTLNSRGYFDFYADPGEYGVKIGTDAPQYVRVEEDDRETLNHSDIGVSVAGLDGNGKVPTAQLPEISGGSTQPVGGWPVSSMTTAVQTSLGKADTAVQPTTMNTALAAKADSSALATETLNRQTADTNINANLANKANDVNTVHRSGDETVNGQKTFTQAPLVGSGTPSAVVTQAQLAPVATAGTYSSLTGTVPQSALPAVALTDFLGAVANQSAMLALSGQRGDWCTRTDLGTDWQLIADTPANLASWREHIYPASPVSSVDGMTGAVSIASDAAPGTASKRTLGTGSTQAAQGSATVNVTGAQTVAGVKNFTSTPQVNGTNIPVASDLAAKANITESVNTVATAGSAQTLPAPTSSTIHYLTLTSASCTVTLPTPVAGQSFTVGLKQDATGGRVVTWSGSVTWTSGSAPTLSTTAGALDLVSFVCLSASDGWLGMSGSSAAASVVNSPDLLFASGGETPMSLYNARESTLSQGPGTLKLVYLRAKRTETITQLYMHTGAAGWTSPTLFRMGVYSIDGSGNGTLIASSSSDTTGVASANVVLQRTLTSSWSKTAGNLYALGFVCAAAAGNAQLVGSFLGHLDLSSISGTRVVANLASQTDLPGSFTVGSLATTANIPFMAALP